VNIRNEHRKSFLRLSAIAVLLGARLVSGTLPGGNPSCGNITYSTACYDTQLCSQCYMWCSGSGWLPCPGTDPQWGEKGSCSY